MVSNRGNRSASSIRRDCQFNFMAKLIYSKLFNSYSCESVLQYSLLICSNQASTSFHKKNLSYNFLIHKHLNKFFKIQFPPTKLIVLISSPATTSNTSSACAVCVVSYFFVLLYLYFENIVARGFDTILLFHQK